MDKVDPLKNPLGHLLVDAPEVLIGLASAVMSGTKVASYFYNKSNKTKNDKQISTAVGLLSSLAIGYIGYRIAKKIKD
jgi:cytochrome bd-type quinol oxidase subunit 2